MRTRILFLLICSIFLSSRLSYAMGLSTTFGRVRVDNIRVGQTYSMENNAKTPLRIENTSDFDLEVYIDLLIPKEHELVEGYEPIPATDWITLSEDTFLLPSHGNISTDVIINVPNEPKYAGKKYQVYIWSHSKGTVAIGLRSKLLISIAD